jgi:tRNA (guanine-N7-)-methyltransferase
LGRNVLRLRKKPWIQDALDDYADIAFKKADESCRGNWDKIFGNKQPIHVELGTGRGRFLTEMAALYPEINFVGLEAQIDVLYYAAKKVRASQVQNLRLMVFDINFIETIFADQEVARLYINFCDPWPKNRHAKRRLTHQSFLERYRCLLPPGGQIFFKTDNEKLFEFSLNEFAGAGLKLGNITFDLHNSGLAGNVMTEYEQRFSNKGLRIFRCEAAFL